MKEKITVINRTLFELETGILLFGAVCQLFVFFVEDKWSYSLGLWLGILIAAVCAVHMYWSLNKALAMAERAAVKSMSLYSLLRYLFILVAFAVIALSRCANPLSAFLGIMGLKASAYLHFVTRKISVFFYGEEAISPYTEESDGGEKM